MIQLAIKDEYWILPSDDENQNQGGGSGQEDNEVMEFLRAMQAMEAVDSKVFEAMNEPTQGMQISPGEGDGEGQSVEAKNKFYFEKLKSIVSKSKGAKKKRW